MKKTIFSISMILAFLLFIHGIYKVNVRYPQIVLRPPHEHFSKKHSYWNAAEKLYKEAENFDDLKDLSRMQLVFMLDDSTCFRFPKSKEINFGTIKYTVQYDWDVEKEKIERKEIF